MRRPRVPMYACWTSCPWLGMTRNGRYRWHWRVQQRGTWPVDETLIKTSDQGWLERLARAYRARLPVALIDDANVGVNPSAQTIFQIARAIEMSPREMAGVAVALGMSVAGAPPVALAGARPGPPSQPRPPIRGGPPPPPRGR